MSTVKNDSHTVPTSAQLDAREFWESLDRGKEDGISNKLDTALIKPCQKLRHFATDFCLGQNISQQDFLSKVKNQLHIPKHDVQTHVFDNRQHVKQQLKERHLCSRFVPSVLVFNTAGLKSNVVVLPKNSIQDPLK